MKTKIYPFDTTALCKGDRIDASLIEQAFGYKRDDPFYRLRAQLVAKAFVEKSFENREPPEIVIVRCSGPDLVVLTTADASAVSERRVENRLDGARRSHLRMAQLPREELSPERLPSHDRSVLVNGRMLAAASSARRELEDPKPRERSTPTVLPAYVPRPEDDLQ